VGTTPDGGFLKLGAGTNTLTRVNTYTGPTIVSNGALVIASGGSLAAGSTVSVRGGATLSVAGTVNGAVTNGGTITTSGSMTGLVTNSGIISGAGTFATNVTITSTGTNIGSGAIAGSVTNGGMLSPGAVGVIATLTVTNNITALAGSTTTLTLNRGAATSNSALASIKGTITYAGTLVVTNIGSALVGGDSFQIFKATNYAGAFATIVPATPGTGLTWNTSNLAVSGTLSVSAVTAPVATIGTIVVSGATFTLSGTGGAPGVAYSVLSTTNVTLPTTNWTVVGSGNFSGAGTFTFNGAINPADHQRFYILDYP
jgi:autotransporter-associated beta strand protein